MALCCGPGCLLGRGGGGKGTAGEGLSHPDDPTSHILSLSYNFRASFGIKT